MVRGLRHRQRCADAGATLHRRHPGHRRRLNVATELVTITATIITSATSPPHCMLRSEARRHELRHRTRLHGLPHDRRAQVCRHHHPTADQCRHRRHHHRLTTTLVTHSLNLVVNQAYELKDVYYQGTLH